MDSGPIYALFVMFNKSHEFYKKVKKRKFLSFKPEISNLVDN